MNDKVADLNHVLHNNLEEASGYEAFFRVPWRHAGGSWLAADGLAGRTAANDQLVNLLAETLARFAARVGCEPRAVKAVALKGEWMRVFGPADTPRGPAFFLDTTFNFLHGSVGLTDEDCGMPNPGPVKFVGLGENGPGPVELPAADEPVTVTGK